MNISIEDFGKSRKGERVLNYIIDTGFYKLEILNFGCTIKSLKYPDKEGIIEDVVLGFDKIEDYDKDIPSYFGCIVGRIAGRTKNGILKIENKNYELTKNDGNNNLHGGINGLHNRVWESSYENYGDKIELIFKTYSNHLEEGFPGNVEFIVKYIVEKESLTLDYLGIPDRDTYMNLTNHVFFNLSGNRKRDIKNQILNFNALGYYAVDDEILPIKFLEKDEIFENGKEFTLKSALESFHEQIIKVGNGYDHPFVLSKKATIDGYTRDIESGRKIEFKTDQPVVVLYTGNFTNTISPYGIYAGLCLETQDYADIGSIKEKKMNIYSPTNHYKQLTTYYFKVIK